MTTQKSFALLTGASRGLGRQIAYELAKRGFNLLLVSLPGEGLDKMVMEPQFQSIEVQYLEYDLTDKQQLYALSEHVNANYQLCMLINNAGMGCSKSMLEADSHLIDQIIQLNITATSILTHRLLPNLLRYRGNAHILNVSSMASYSPIAYKTVYPASKRFVHNFSMGLRYELKGTNVFVSVTHPGPMLTNNEIREKVKHLGLWAKCLLVSPELSAKITVSRMLRKQNSIIPGVINKINWLLMSVLPEFITISIISGQYKKASNS
jgi:short-subunit dehydrogenase